MSHTRTGGVNPVGAAIAGGVGAALQGGGVPGVAISIVASTISAFRRERPPPPFPPLRMALWGRWQRAFRPFVRTIGKAWVDEFNKTAERQFRSDSTTWDRKGLWTVNDSFFQLSNHDAQEILDAMASGRLTIERTDITQVNPIDLPGFITGEPDLTKIPETGGELMVAKIDRGTFTEGLDEEMPTGRQGPNEISELIIPTVEMGRYIVYPAVEGAADQFFADISVPAATPITGLRIAGSAPENRNQTIYIRRAHLSISPESVGTPVYRFFAGAAVKGAVVATVKMHFEVNRRHSGLPVESAIADIEVGDFTVPAGMDYLMRMDNLGVVPVRMSGSVEGFIIRKGINGSKC